MYRDLDIPYDQEDPQWSRLKSLASSKGLRYTQSLKFGSCSFTELGFCKELDDLLPRLRKDSLKRFEFGGLGRPTHEMMEHLWKNQRCLRNLQLNFELLSPSVDDILGDDAPSLNLLQSVDELDVNFAGTVNADSANKLLSFLHLRCIWNIKITVMVVPRYPQVASFGDGFFTQHFPATLTHITLNFVVLPAPEDLQLDLYPGLVYLNLHECRNTERVLDAFRRPVLRELLYCDTDHGLDEPPARALGSMLGRFRNLEKLVLDINWCLRPWDHAKVAMGISTHRTTLKSLLLGGKGVRPGATPRLFLQIAPLCTQLRQLALQFHPASVLDDCKASLYHILELIIMIF